jgi:phytoene/squalene synthetase
LRPWLLARGVLANRQHPSLDRLAAIDDPERFCWAILPHAARSFAASILLLPAAEARAAAIGYLYARMLDSYEDLHPDPVLGRVALHAFGQRLAALPSDPPALPSTNARDDRDRVHLLLVERCGLVDELYEDLPADHRQEVQEMVADMAEGMAWASRTFEEQGGVLETEDQLRRYCHIVIGVPSRFVMKLLLKRPLTEAEEADAMAVAELLQLANVTRDIEKDLRRGVGYHPDLRPYLGHPTAPEEAAAVLQTVRRQLLLMALNRAGSYRRLVEQVDLPRVSVARAAAVVMLSFTDLHYRAQVRLAGLPTWTGPRRKTTIVLSALPAAVSPRWSRAMMRRVERDFSAAAHEGALTA